MGFKNGLSYAGQGAALGSFAGPAGTAIGGALGFLGGLFGGSDDEEYTPIQMGWSNAYRTGSGDYQTDYSQYDAGNAQKMSGYGDYYGGGQYLGERRSAINSEFDKLNQSEDTRLGRMAGTLAGNVHGYEANVSKMGLGTSSGVIAKAQRQGALQNAQNTAYDASLQSRATLGVEQARQLSYAEQLAAQTGAQYRQMGMQSSQFATQMARANQSENAQRRFSLDQYNNSLLNNAAMGEYGNDVSYQNQGMSALAGLGGMMLGNSMGTVDKTGKRVGGNTWGVLGNLF